VLQAGHFPHEDGHFPHEDGYAPGLNARTTPPIFVDEGFPTIETIDGAVIESVPFLVPPAPSVPSFTPLDPPDAPAPTTPPHCVSRELPLDDPAGSWRLIPPGTVVRRLSMPGDLDELSETSIATTMTRTTTGDATTRVATMATTATSEATPPGRERIITPGTATRSIIFDCPAYFPIVRFKDRTTSYDDEGLRIVEGMVLRFDDEGRYEVEFQAQGIATPVVLRLQLTVNFKDPSSPIGSLTLPPIRLDPLTQARLDDGRADDAAWLVVHRGWSSRLRRAFVRRSDLDGFPLLDVRRDGAARFGSGLPPNRFLPR